MADHTFVCLQCGVRTDADPVTESKPDIRTKKFCGVEQRHILCDVCGNVLFRSVKPQGSDSFIVVSPPELVSPVHDGGTVVDIQTDNLGKPRAMLKKKEAVAPALE